jgi:hypothetical protein
MVLRRQLFVYFFFSEPAQQALHNAHTSIQKNALYHRRQFAQAPAYLHLALPCGAASHTVVKSLTAMSSAYERETRITGRRSMQGAHVDLFLPSGFQKAFQVWSRDSRMSVSLSQTVWERARTRSQLSPSATRSCIIHTIGATQNVHLDNVAYRIKLNGLHSSSHFRFPRFRTHSS